MPTLAVERNVLFDHLGREYTDDEFDELCFDFGVELDEVTSERMEATKSMTAKVTRAQLAALSDEVVYKIDVPANRYDLLCVEGLSRALKVFLGTMEAPTYTVTDNNDNDANNGNIQMTVMKTNVDQIRPFVVCAVLRNITLTQQTYDSFIDFQDQLHRNLCRNRSLVAIGTHDLDTVQPPFVYDARPPADIDFCPLTHPTQSFPADELLELYETDPSAKHLKPYVSLIKESSVYPVIVDANETVLSLPPIINGHTSKITLETTNVLIECTATDLTKANIVLDTIVAMFSEYTMPVPYSVERVTVTYQDEYDNQVLSYGTPIMATRTERASVDFVNSLIGIDLSPQQMKALCYKVMLGPAELVEDEQEDDDGNNKKVLLQVTVPPTRSDILHPVDIAEDIGIAYGYNNIVKRVPTTSTVGGEFALNKIGDLLRDEIGRAGYVEILTHGLCSIRDNFTALRRPVTPDVAVSLSNPANVEYQVVRTTLLPGLLKTLQHNKSASFANGFKIFEISDVVLVDVNHVVAETIVGAKNRRRICAVYAGPTSGFEVIHGLVDRIMTLTEVAPEEDYVKSSSRADEERFRVTRVGWYYTIAELDPDDPTAGTYFPGRAAEVLLTSPHGGMRVRIGTFGILHPEVLANFDIQYPASCMELDLESLL